MAAEEENNLLGAEVDSPSPGSKESPWSQGYRGQRRRETAKSWIIVCLSITTLMSVALAALPMLSFEPKGSAGAGIYQALPTALRSELRFTTRQSATDAWHDMTYVGEPSVASNNAWIDLLKVRSVWMLPNESRNLAISGLHAPKGTTATLLGVMHNLHCIRRVREILYPHYYAPNQSEADRRKDLEHAGHCLESLRQAVMCTPNLTPYAVLWEDERRTQIKLNASAKQTCVDWEALVRWEETRAYDLNDLWDDNPIPGHNNGLNVVSR